MFTGRSVILVMVALGVLLIAGYEFVRRAALPSGVSEVKDLGGAERFDKVYTFEGTRYHVRVGSGEGLSATGTISIATLADDGSNATSIIHPRTGPIREVHFLDVEVDGPPALAVILAHGCSGAHWLLISQRPMPFAASRNSARSQDVRSSMTDLHRRRQAARPTPLQPRPPAGRDPQGLTCHRVFALSTIFLGTPAAMGRLTP